jgi:DNA mismatch repair protein MutS
MPQRRRSADKSRPKISMIEQYIEIKAANPDCLLFYRMGEFYEMFFGDAEVASRALGIVLTKRDKHLGADVPMCGVNIRSADQYLQRLIKLGHRVAVCEQLEDPAEARKRGSKALVQRDVVRLVTPGTLTEDSLLDASRNNFLAALTRIGGNSETQARFGLAWIDISTGGFWVLQTTRSQLSGELARINPAEIIIADTLQDDPAIILLRGDFEKQFVTLPRELFDSASAAKRLEDYFQVQTLDGFAAFERAELAAAAAVLAYVDKTQLGARPPLDRPIRQTAAASMQIDAATRRNLELTQTLSGERVGSLLQVIDQTATGAGSRLLAARLANPLTDAEKIGRRQDSVAWFLAANACCDATREMLRATPDMARALSRLMIDRGGPRDLAAVRDGLENGRAIAELIATVGTDNAAELAGAVDALAAIPPDLQQQLARALGPELPLLIRDGGFIAQSYNGDLDHHRSLRDESRRVVAALQAQYAELTAIKSLKIRHNRVLGYFVDVTAGHSEKMISEPLNKTFIHRQTLANAVRFTTTELADLESQIAQAGDRSTVIEHQLFADLVGLVAQHLEAIKAAAAAFAVVDVSAAMSVLAERHSYCRPRVDRSLAFTIEGGRHPVVEQALRLNGSDAFVANHCDIGETENQPSGQLWIVTGPNMAGKSTFLRQNALIALLAQMGAYVPARNATIGIVDRLFSRVGAADDLARGRSTFMVEMVETAAILNQAGPRSLVILDEIGRGTATFDGLSIAWAAIEHLHEINRSRALFATHYHELTTLAQKLPRLVNVTVKVTEWKGDVIFLHEIVSGAADRSYGIQVAKLAGLPATVIGRARQVLAQLEETDRRSPEPAMIDDLPLFSAAAHAQATIDAGNNANFDAVAEQLEAVYPDDLSPREALDILYALKSTWAAANKTQG